MNKFVLYIILITSTVLLFSCSKKEGCTDPNATNFNPDADREDGSCIYNQTPPSPNGQPTPAPLQIPQLFAQYISPPFIPTNNPQTVEGIALGRHLFYDPILSVDSTQACATCHMPFKAWGQSTQFATGVTGAIGTRNSMPLFNMAWNWNEKFFWDGRAIGLEEQALGPVTNPIEMNNTWQNAVASLQAHPKYPAMFQAAFGTSIIDSILVAKALAQFERILISSNSKFDNFLMSQASLTPAELNGFNIFMNENAGDCFHCHGNASNPLWTDNAFHNNGLDSIFSDNGLGIVTGNPVDNGKFKSPSLRNLAFTAPYMHDGRFSTLEEVINHYSEGLVNSPTIDPLMKSVGQGGVQLTPTEKADLKAFLLTLTDYNFIQDTTLLTPF